MSLFLTLIWISYMEAFPIQMQPKYTVSCSPATYFYFVYFVNSSNAEAPYHTSSNAGYG